MFDSIIFMIMALKENLKKYGFTISKVAEELGITQPSLSAQIKTGTIAYSRLVEIAEIMGISVAELVADSKEIADPCAQAVKCPCCGTVLHVELSADKKAQ